MDFLRKRRATIKQTQVRADAKKGDFRLSLNMAKQQPIQKAT
jgi:hypothetical protein